MNIIQVLSHRISSGDGICKHVIGLANRLNARGHKITIVTYGHCRDRKEFEYEGFRVIKIPFYPVYPLHIYLYGYFLRKAIETFLPRPDLIHLHTPLVPAVPKKWPIVTTFHTPMLVDTAHIENVGLKSLLIKLMGKTTSYWTEKKLLNISDAVITVSQGVAEELKTYYGYRDSLYPILNVVDMDFYKPLINNQKEKKLLYIGRLAYRKGLFEIINSARAVIKKYPDVKYSIVGSGPLEKRIKEMVSRYERVQHFKFFGEIRDCEVIRKHYQEASIVLIPSYYEGLPMTLLEAMACGKAIITSNASFSKGIIKDRINAILVKTKSSKELANASIKLLSSWELQKTLGEEARKSVLNRMDPEVNINKVEEVYEIAIKKWRQRN